jgi:hypothetical protein
MVEMDLKKEWPKMQAELVRIGREAQKLAKEGERELRYFTQQSKLQVDKGALALKKEHLFYLVGKQYVKDGASAVPGATLKELLEQLVKLEDEEARVAQQLKVTAEKAKAERKKG